MDINEAKNSLALGKFVNFIMPEDKPAFINLAKNSKSINDLVKKPMFEKMTRERRQIFNMKLKDVIEFGK